MSAPNTNEPVAFDLVQVTPDLAKTWLETSIGNRSERQPTIDAYAQDMANDRWKLTPDPIGFDRDGHMYNGHHRCFAVIKAGRPIWMFVARNVDPDARYVTDSGVKRTAGDMLKYDGFANYNSLAAMARVDISYRAGHYKYAGQTSNGMNVSRPRIRDWVIANESEAQEALKVGDFVRRGVGPRPPLATLAFLVRLLSAKDQGDATAFFDAIAHQKHSGPGDPIYTLSLRYANAKAGEFKVPQHVFLFIRTWNAIRRGEELSQLKITVRLDMPEPI